MPSLRGSYQIIYPSTTIPGTAAVAMTAFRAEGNSVEISLTTTVNGVLSLTFTAERAPNGSDYGAVIDENSAWSMVVTTPTTAGTYTCELKGLVTSPGEMVRLSYTAQAASGKLAVAALSWDNPAGDNTVEADVSADMGTIDASTAASAASLATLVTAEGLGVDYIADGDAAFLTGDSPETVDVNTGLSRNGNKGWITNDGAGDFTLSISKVGTPTWGNEITLKNGETYSFDGLDVDQFRLTWVANSAYRYFIQ